MINKKRKLSDLFYNNRFLLIFSVVAAIAIWVVVAVEFSPETKVTIKNVPIKVMSTGAKGSTLAPFGADNLTVDVTIVGKRYIVEDDAIINDIEAVANSGYINSSGIQKLTVDVGSVSTRPQYEIASYTVNEVEVLFDYYVEKQVPVLPEFSVDGNVAADGYFADEFVPIPSTVTVYGPKSEVDFVSSVNAIASVDGGLTKSTGYTAGMSIVTANSSAPKYVKIKSATDEMEAGNVYVNIPVYKEYEAKAEVNFTDVPGAYRDKYPFNYTVEPETAVFGFSGEESESVAVATISFSDIEFDKNGEYKITVKFDGNQGVVVKDESTGMADAKEFVVTIVKDDLTVKEISLPSADNPYYIDYTGTDKVFSYEVIGYDDYESVTVNGPEADVVRISKDDLKLDFSGVSKDSVGKISVPVVLDGKYKDCWLTYKGEEATVSVDIKAN